MNNLSQPVFLNLLKLRLPAAGVMSIAHRIAGVLLFFSIPLMLYLLQTALSGEQGFAHVRLLLRQPLPVVGLFLLLWALSHHWLAGIRYLLIDAHVGVNAPAFRYSAWAVLLGAPVLAALLLWGLYA